MPNCPVNRAVQERVPFCHFLRGWPGLSIFKIGF